jgi:hypothetical protein
MTKRSCVSAVTANARVMHTPVHTRAGKLLIELRELSARRFLAAAALLLAGLGLLPPDRGVLDRLALLLGWRSAGFGFEAEYLRRNHPVNAAVLNGADFPSFTVDR